MKASSAFDKIRASLAYAKLRAAADAALLAASVTASRLAATISAASLKASTSYTSLAATARYSALAVTTALGEFVKFFYLRNRASVTDAMRRTLSKLRADRAGAADRSSRSVSKARLDAPSATDQSSRNLGKAKADTASAEDDSALDVDKPRADFAGAADDVDWKTLGRLLSNATSPFDAISIISTFRRFFVDQAHTTDERSKAVSKTRSDTASADDVPLRTFGKGVADDASALDDSVRDFLKALRDNVVPTDDVDATTVDDEQNINLSRLRSDRAATNDVLSRTVEYLRSLADAATTGDSLERVFTKAKHDAAAVADEKSIDSDKVRSDTTMVYEQLVHAMFRPRDYADSVSGDDQHTINTIKSPFDAAAAGDAKSIDFVSGRSDSALAAEDFSRTVEYIRSTSDTSVANDLAAIATSKRFADGAGAYEAAAKHLIRSVVDSIVVTDELETGARGNYGAQDYPSVVDIILTSVSKTFAEQITISDESYWSINKAPADAPVVTEMRQKSAEKMKDDVVSTYESGSVRSQNYCDMAYIAEDYVGVSREI